MRRTCRSTSLPLIILSFVTIGAQAAPKAPNGEMLSASTILDQQKFLPQAIAEMVRAGEVSGPIASFPPTAKNAQSNSEREINLADLNPGLGSAQLWDIGGDLVTERQNRAVRRLSFRLGRYHEREPKSRVVLRERVELLSPDVVRQYSWFTLRLRGAEADLVWVGSPATKKIRQIEGSNRGDEFVSGGPSVDDWFVWSAKPESYQVLQKARGRALVPWSDAKTKREPLERTGCSGIIDVKFDSGEERALGKSLWTGAVSFAVRPVRHLEIANLDPFYRGGVEELIVDEESLVPVYKIVRTSTGAIDRVVIGAMIKIDETVLPGIVMTKRFVDQETTNCTLKKMTQCASAFLSDELRKFFDPGAFVVRTSDLPPTPKPEVRSRTESVDEAEGSDPG